MFVDRDVTVVRTLLVVIAAVFLFDVMEILPGLIRGNITVPASSQLYIFGTMIISAVYCIAALFLAYRIRRLLPFAKPRIIYSIAALCAILVGFDLIVLRSGAPFIEDIIAITIAGILIWLINRTPAARF